MSSLGKASSSDETWLGSAEKSVISHCLWRVSNHWSRGLLIVTESEATRAMCEILAYLASLDAVKLLCQSVELVCSSTSNDYFLAHAMETAGEGFTNARGGADDKDGIELRSHDCNK